MLVWRYTMFENGTQTNESLRMIWMFSVTSNLFKRAYNRCENESGKIQFTVCIACMTEWRSAVRKTDDTMSVCLALSTSVQIRDNSERDNVSRTRSFTYGSTLIGFGSLPLSSLGSLALGTRNCWVGIMCIRAHAFVSHICRWCV